ncbi:hypothetical protein C8F01DRAFT_1170174 [Mycena amicta]|nr:hypothetical protein C8F01DRAFT_1170174 [Mycena amicta]
MQASYTDIILINKWEHVDERTLDGVLDSLYTLNELTPKIRCIGRYVDPELIFGLESKLFAEPPTIAPTHNDEVETLTLYTGKSLHRPHDDDHKHAHDVYGQDDTEEGPDSIDEHVLSDALNNVSKEYVWRIKGFVRLTGKGLYILNWAFGRYDLVLLEDDNGEKGALTVTVMGERGEVRRHIGPFGRLLGVELKG